jgi:hypothetical protein
MTPFCTAHNIPKIFGYVQVSPMKRSAEEWRKTTRNWTCGRKKVLKQR